MNRDRKDVLAVAATVSFAVALLHIAIIVAGPTGYWHFGAPALADAVEPGSVVRPALLTFGVTLVFALWGAYALSGAALVQGALKYSRALVFSGASMFTGLCYLLGAARAWVVLGPRRSDAAQPESVALGGG